MKTKLGLLASLAAGALLASPAGAQQKIKVGNLVDYTGATSSTGKFSGPGKVDAIAWVNANGGINGKMLEADTVDYSYQTQRAIQLYKKWKDEGAIAILGYGTNDTEAMVGFIAEDKMPYFSFSFSGHLTDPTGISPKAKEGKVKPAPYNFFGAASYSDGARALILWAAEDWKKKGTAGKPKYIHLGDNHPYPLAPKEAGENLARESGFDVLPSIQYALAGGDFKAQCLALQSSGANYAFLANTTGANVALLRSCATVGVNVQFMANVWGMDEAGMKAVGKGVDGLVQVLGQAQWGSDVPGMKVLHFAFGSGNDNDYLPHNHVPNCVVYTGTHDNDTTLGWWQAAPSYIQDHWRRYLARDGSDVVWESMRVAFASVAHTAIVPFQDVLALDGGARMNLPGVADGNWSWRVRLDAFHPNLSSRMRELLDQYQRIVEPPSTITI